MLALARSMVIDQPISLEVEKERPGLDRLLSYPDLIFFSRPFARGRGFEEPESFLRAAREWAPQAILVVTWGDQGASLLIGDRFVSEAARPVSEVIDTVGAGDTFIAGFIHGRVSGRTLEEALVQGCRLAERKIARDGFEGLATEPAGSTRLPEQPLITLSELPDPGAAGFEIEDIAGPRSVFLVKRDGQVRAYENVCPHIGAKLNRQPDAFLDADGRHIRCAVHGALFRIEDGRCIHGPCVGESLKPLSVRIESGKVWLVNKSER